MRGEVVSNAAASVLRCHGANAPAPPPPTATTPSAATRCPIAAHPLPAAAVIPPFHAAVDRAVSYLDREEGLLGAPWVASCLA